MLEGKEKQQLWTKDILPLFVASMLYMLRDISELGMVPELNQSVSLEKHVHEVI